MIDHLESVDEFLGKITTCLATLLLIYVVMATIDHVVCDFAARCASGLVKESEIWRMEQDLNGAAKQQVWFVVDVLLQLYVNKKCHLLRVRD